MDFNPPINMYIKWGFEIMNVSLNAAITSQTFSQQTSSNQSAGSKLGGISQYQSFSFQQTSVEVNISIDSAPLDLAYQSAIDKINEQVAPFLGEQSIQRGYADGIDVSPEATAGRILDFATGIFEQFKAQHPGESLESVTVSYVEVITSGVTQGFGEAQDILGGLGVLEGDIASNIDKTFDLVIQGLNDFTNQLLGKTSE